MSTDDDTRTVDISAWVERARSDPQRYRERQATEVLLAAVGQSAPYGEKLDLKGGVLMGVVYRSPRQTADIDFTAADFPALTMTIAFAERESNSHKQLEHGRCPTVLRMEISFRELVHAVQFVRFNLGVPAGVCTYSRVDRIAEKLHALLQQDVRGRNRRQDIYDIDFLIRDNATRTRREGGYPDGPAHQSPGPPYRAGAGLARRSRGQATRRGGVAHARTRVGGSPGLRGCF